MDKTFDELLFEENQEEVFLDVCLSEDGNLIDIVSQGSTLKEVIESTTAIKEADDFDDLEDERLFEEE
jgi:hypothetical protein